MNIKKYFPVLILVALVIFFQLLTMLLGVNYYLTQLTMSTYYALAVIGLCMLMGYAGQISLGQAGFFAIGGYTSAALTTYKLINYKDVLFIEFLKKIKFLMLMKNPYGEEILHVAPWVAFLIAILITICIAFVIGMPVLKLKGHYLAMATLGFGIIVYRIAIGSKIFGEADGITNVPEFAIIPGVVVSGSFSERIQNYYIAWFFVIIGIIILINLIHSRAGRALRALHGNELSVNAMGVNTSRYKLNIFVLSAVFASLGGILLTHYNGGIGPSEASITKSIRYVAIVAIGGMANIWGALIMGIILNFLSLRGVFGTYDDAVFGIILIFIMIFAPNGLLQTTIAHKVRSFIKSKKGNHNVTN